ncbi:MAG: hypothetical protein OXH79_06765 [Boseongicola sp.]|nr:hypothetical protein [Boseongicola sp.]
MLSRVFTELQTRHFDVLGSRFGHVGVAPPMTLLGVARLALPTLVFQLEAATRRRPLPESGCRRDGP